MATVAGGTAARAALSVGEAVGPVPREIFGHFSEHLLNVVYGGMHAELLVNRRFDMPGLRHRIEAVAQGWERVGGDDVRCRRGESHESSPHMMAPGRDAHHAQIVDFAPGRIGGGGIAQGGLTLDQGTRYVAQVRCNVAGPIERVTLTLHSVDGQVLASSPVSVPDAARWPAADLGHRVADPVTLETILECSRTCLGALSVVADPPHDAHASLWLHSVSLLPEGSAGGLHAGVIQAVGGMPAVVVKWPGGCFADGYDWRLGVGPRDLRHGAPDPAWGTWDENDFGTDEFLRWCEFTGSQPYLCVNHGSGTPEQAAAWVEYCNGSVETEWGARRARNGHPEPYDVRLWAIGNEVFGFWERGAAPPDVYADNVRRFAAAMRAVDATITIAAQGDLGPYTEALLPRLAGVADLLSVHHYSMHRDPGDDPAAYLAEARNFEPALRRVVGIIESTPEAGGMRIALDEWGWTPAVDDPISCVFAACVLNAMARLAPHVAVAGHCCVVNPMAPVQRTGEVVRRTRLYDVFTLYVRLYRATAHRVDGLPPEIDGIAFSDANSMSLLLANTSDREIAVQLPPQEAYAIVTRISAHTAWDVPLQSDVVLLAGHEVVGVATCE